VIPKTSDATAKRGFVPGGPASGEDESLVAAQGLLVWARQMVWIVGAALVGLIIGVLVGRKTRTARGGARERVRPEETGD